MVIAILPVGGKALRLGLPYPKELLPLKGFDHYRPLISHVVDKMIAAGAERLVFVHGREYKEEVRRLYPECQHLKQAREGFARVLEDCWLAGVEDGDKILFGLPDSLFEDNPFGEMLERGGIVTGLFTTSPDARVDRLTLSKRFDVKSPKTDGNLDLFWGVIKMDGSNLREIVESGILNETNEIGEILNRRPFEYVVGGAYRDLGTWAALNSWWSAS